MPLRPARSGTEARFARLREWFTTGRGEATLVAPAVLVTAAYLVWHALQVEAYVWLVDELLYVKGGLGFADGHLTGHVYGQAASVYSSGYAWLLAPIYGIFPSETAFQIAHVANALLFAGVIVPVYLTAKRLGATMLMSLLAGLLAVCVPWAVATLVLMSESLTYFAFAWAVWGMTRALSEPSPRSEGVAVALVAAVAFCRPQFVLLFPVFVLTVILCELRRDNARLGERLREHRVVAIVAGAGVLIYAVAGNSILGGYSGTAGVPRFPPGLWPNMIGHLAHVIAGAGVFTAVCWLGWVMRAGAPESDRTHTAFAILSGLIVAVVAYVAGFINENYVSGLVQERYVFYIVPLFVLGMAALSADRPGRGPRVSMLAAGGAIGLVLGGVPFSQAEAPNTFSIFQSAASSFNGSLKYHFGRLDPLIPGAALPITEKMAAAAVIAGVVATVLSQPRIRRAGLPLAAVAVLLFTSFEARETINKAVPGLNSVIPARLSRTPLPKAWVDRGIDGDAGIVMSPMFSNDDRNRWLWIEFWNKSIARLYSYRGRLSASGLPAVGFEVNEDDGAISGDLTDSFVMSAADPELSVQGRVLRRGPFETLLVKPTGAPRAAWTVLGGDPNLELKGVSPRAGKQLQLRVFRPQTAGPGEAVRVDVEFELAASRSAARSLRLKIVTASGSRPVELRPGQVQTIRLRVTMAPADAHAVIMVAEGGGPPNRRGVFAVRAVKLRLAE